MKRPDVQAVLGDAMVDLPRFEKLFQLESRMRKTRNVSTAGSQTAERAALDGEMNVNTGIAVASQLARGQIASGATTWIKDIVDKYLGMRSDVAESIARKLTTMDKPAMLRLADSLNRMSGTKNGMKVVSEVLRKRDIATQLASRGAAQVAALPSE